MGYFFKGLIYHSTPTQNRWVGYFFTGLIYYCTPTQKQVGYFFTGLIYYSTPTPKQVGGILFHGGPLHYSTFQHHKSAQKLAQIAIRLAVSQSVSRFVMLTLMPAAERQFGLFVFTKISHSHEQAVFTQ